MNQLFHQPTCLASYKDWHRWFPPEMFYKFADSVTSRDLRMGSKSPPSNLGLLRTNQQFLGCIKSMEHLLENESEMVDFSCGFSMLVCGRVLVVSDFICFLCRCWQFGFSKPLGHPMFKTTSIGHIFRSSWHPPPLKWWGTGEASGTCLVSGQIAYRSKGYGCAHLIVFPGLIFQFI